MSAVHTKPFTSSPSRPSRLGAVSPTVTAAWSRGTFAPDSVVGIGRRERQPVTFFPAAAKRYALSFRGDLEYTRIESGTLRGIYSGAPWLENASYEQAAQPKAMRRSFDALMGSMERPKSQRAEEMRAWVSSAAPPLVYEAARARHEREPALWRRDELAARWRIKAAERDLDKPRMLTFREQRQMTEAKLRESFGSL